MERGRRRPARRSRRAPRPHPRAPSAQRIAATLARSRGRAHLGRATAGVPALRAPTRVPPGRRVRQRPAGVPRVQGQVRDDRAHGRFGRQRAARRVRGAEQPVRFRRLADAASGRRALRPRRGRRSARSLAHAVAGGRSTVPDPVVHPRRRRSAGSPRDRQRHGTASSRRSTSRPTRCRATSSR